MQPSAAPGSSQGKRDARWMYSVLPVSIATGPLGTLIALYLVNLNGRALGTIYASLAVAGFNGVSIPAAIFWGRATDRFHSRKPLIAASYSLMALTLFALSIVNTSIGVITVYALFSFISAAAATPPPDWPSFKRAFDELFAILNGMNLLFLRLP